MSTKKSDAAAYERATKVRDWIGAQRELLYTAKDAAEAIFGEGYTKAEQHYVSSVLSKHSTGEDAPVALVGKKHRNGSGGRSDFVYQTLSELPKPRAAFFATTRGHIRGKTSTMRKVNFIENVTPAVEAFAHGIKKVADDINRAIGESNIADAGFYLKEGLAAQAAMEAAEVTPATAQRLFKEAVDRHVVVTKEELQAAVAEPSTTERLLDIAIHNDRGANILPMLLRLAADIADKEAQQ